MLKHLGWPAWLIALVMTVGAGAQAGGTIAGVVRDAQGQPVAGARITVDQLEGEGRRVEATTDEHGAFALTGLAPGNYRVSAVKNRFVTDTYQALVRTGRTARVTFALAAGAAEPVEAISSQTIVLRRAFADGVAAAVAGDPDTAIQKFTEAIDLDPRCTDCYYNLGIAFAQKKAYGDAETAFRKVLELKPDFPDARRNLANALYNHGVTEWNAGRVPGARQQFEAAVAADPEQAEAHFRLGITLVNAGELARAADEFETYLHLAPDGANAQQARDHLIQLKRKPR